MASSQNEPKSVSDILRTLPDENSFQFYNGIDSPTGLKAHNLTEFVSLIESAPPSSVDFHSKRHDFENWVRMLGDPTLGKQLQTLSNQNISPEELKSKVLRILRMRLGKLRKLAHTV